MYLRQRKCVVSYTDPGNSNNVRKYEGVSSTDEYAYGKANSSCLGHTGDSHKCEQIAEDKHGNKMIHYSDIYIEDPSKYIDLDGSSVRNNIRNNVHRWACLRSLSPNGKPFVSGHGPVEWYNDGIQIVLFSQAVVLNIVSSEIGPRGPAHPDRISEIYHYCQNHGYAGGFGPVEWSGGYEAVVAFTAEQAGLPFQASDSELAACGGALKVFQVHRMAQQKGYLTGFLVDWTQGGNVIFPAKKEVGIIHGMKYSGSISAWGP
jgi:hypothetical protein